MRNKKVGIYCIILGLCCLLVSAGFIIHNHWAEKNAEKASEEILLNVQAQHGTEADGYECIGVLSIPVLELELPVLTDWSYDKLRIAPCLYYGSVDEENFVIAAHNYRSHFGRLSELQSEDLVLFTDASGVTHYYEVVLLETLPPKATKEMITSGFDLSLYTCTPSGNARVTVRCCEHAL